MQTFSTACAFALLSSSNAVARANTARMAPALRLASPVSLSASTRRLAVCGAGQEPLKLQVAVETSSARNSGSSRVRDARMLSCCEHPVRRDDSRPANA
jgi:hypothetical protein